MISKIVKNSIKKDLKTFISIFIVMLVSFTFLFLSISMSANTKMEIEKRLDKEGFGDMLTLTSGKTIITPILDYLTNNENIESVKHSQIIFSSYEFNNNKSDVDAILFKESDQKTENILNNEIILPISMKGILNIDIDDEILISIKRDRIYKLRVKKFFEDAIFGSSMLGIKKFYIDDELFDEIKNELSNDSIDNLAKTGYAFFLKAIDGVEFKTLSNIWYDNPNLANEVEHMYSRHSIISHMSLLMNIFTAFIFVFAILMAIVEVLIIYYVLKNDITYDKTNISNLKIIGYKSYEIFLIYLIVWNIPILFAFLMSTVFAKPLMMIFYNMTYIANGILYESKINFYKTLPIIFTIILFANVIIIWNLKKIYRIKPVETKTKNYFTNKKYALITSNSIKSISIRELVSRKRHYIMLVLLCALLSVFNNQIYRINTWLDNGHGLMNSFNPTDMDFGVQSIKDVDIEEVIKEVDASNGIEYSYLLGMGNLNVDGYNLRANVSSDTEKFHILSGRTIKDSDEVLITDIVSNNFNKKIGDYISIRGTKSEGKFKVVGIYECANEMGENIGISKTGFETISNTPKNFYCHHFFLKNKNVEHLTKSLSEKYGATLYIHTNTWSGLNSIVSAMNTLIIILIFLTVILAVVITIIQVNSTIKNEKDNLDIYKLLGFNKKDIATSFAIRFIIVSTVGVLMGVVIVKLFADELTNILFRNFGICAYKSHFTVYNIVLSLFIIFIFGILSYYYSYKSLKKIGRKV